MGLAFCGARGRREAVLVASEMHILHLLCLGEWCVTRVRVVSGAPIRPIRFSGEPVSVRWGWETGRDRCWHEDKVVRRHCDFRVVLEALLGLAL